MNKWFYFLAILMAGGLSMSTTSSRMHGPRWQALPLRNKKLALELIKRARAQGLEVDFFDGWRPAAEQERLMKAGASKVVDPYSSYHVWGEAFDIVFRKNGQWTWPPSHVKRADGSQTINPEWEKLGRLGEQLGLTWGGRWSWFDGAHFQTNFVTTDDLKFNYGHDVAGYLRAQGLQVIS